MIDWIKSAEMNDCTIEWLKDWTDKHPKSNKKVWRVCEGEGCTDERAIRFCDCSDLCQKCSIRTPEVRKAALLKAIEVWSDQKNREAARLRGIKQFSTQEARDKASKMKLKEKDPLPIDKEILIPENKNCSNYLGCIAEEILARTFKNIRRMPPGNHGFDLICGNGYKIEVKSSATGNAKNRWNFNINKNTIADFFLCVSFESRNDLIPVHLWLIPGKDINHLLNAVIHKSTLNKWDKYEQPLDRVLSCCNVMKGEYNEK